MHCASYNIYEYLSVPSKRYMVTGTSETRYEYDYLRTEVRVRPKINVIAT